MRLRVALAFVVVLAAGCTGAGSSASRTPPPSIVAPSTVSPAPADPRSVALDESTRLIGAVLLPPGARPMTRAPVPTLRSAPTRPSSPYLLDVPRWWSLPISASSALSWLHAHPPRGLRLSSTGSGVGPGGPSGFLSYSDRTAPSYSLATLVLDVAPDGRGGSALRSDGQTLWVPSRPAAEAVPTDVSAVRLIAYRGSGCCAARHVLAHRMVRGAKAAELARLANALLRDNRGVVNCANDTGFRISAMFVAVQRELVFTEDPACGSVSVTSGGVAQPGLLIDAAFQRALSKTLGLSPNAR